jgi:hypothetical protein
MDEVYENAELDSDSLAKGVVAFAEDYEKRMAELEAMLGSARG